MGNDFDLKLDISRAVTNAPTELDPELRPMARLAREGFREVPISYQRQRSPSPGQQPPLGAPAADERIDPGPVGRVEPVIGAAAGWPFKAGLAGV